MCDCPLALDAATNHDDSLGFVVGARTARTGRDRDPGHDRRIEPTLGAWPKSIKLLRSVITAKHRFAPVLAGGNDASATVATLADVAATIAAYRSSGVESGAVSALCAGSLAFVARARLDSGDVAGAWATAELAMEHQTTPSRWHPRIASALHG